MDILIFEETNQYDLALRDFTSALKWKPNFAQAYAARAHVYELLGKDDLSWRDLSAASHFGMHFKVTTLAPVDENLDKSKKDQLRVKKH